jgi:hypothetical protein
MPLVLAPEPTMFDSRVRRRGSAYLARVPRPTAEQFRTHAFWREALTELHNAYRGICAYSCHWIPRDTGADTVEHFRPKSVEPALAYEWTNYRLVCATLNGRKGDSTVVLDPMSIEWGWFWIEFPSLLVKPGDDLPADVEGLVSGTIERLGLNDELTCLSSRLRYTRDYCRRCVNWELMQRDAPFLASEIERQGLRESLPVIMQFDDISDPDWPEAW